MGRAGNSFANAGSLSVSARCFGSLARVPSDPHFWETIPPEVRAGQKFFSPESAATTLSMAGKGGKVGEEVTDAASLNALRVEPLGAVPYGLGHVLTSNAQAVARIAQTLGGAVSKLGGPQWESATDHASSASADPYRALRDAEQAPLILGEAARILLEDRNLELATVKIAEGRWRDGVSNPFTEADQEGVGLSRTGIRVRMPRKEEDAAGLKEPPGRSRSREAYQFVYLNDGEADLAYALGLREVIFRTPGVGFKRKGTVLIRVVLDELPQGVTPVMKDGTRTVDANDEVFKALDTWEDRYRCDSVTTTGAMDQGAQATLGSTSRGGDFVDRRGGRERDEFDAAAPTGGAAPDMSLQLDDVVGTGSGAKMQGGFFPRCITSGYSAVWNVPLGLPPKGSVPASSDDPQAIRDLVQKRGATIRTLVGYQVFEDPGVPLNVDYKKGINIEGRPTDEVFLM
jgi:hypothetical protein